MADETNKAPTRDELRTEFDALQDALGKSMTPGGRDELRTEFDALQDALGKSTRLHVLLAEPDWNPPEAA